MVEEKTISVVIPTYNRPQELRSAISGLLNQKVPRSIRYEIIVVDNSPTDALGEEIKNLNKSSNVPIRLIHEKIPGVARARNIGVEHSGGEIVAFIDDDATADENWLKELVVPYDDPKVVSVGGKISPVWLSEKPEWYSNKLDHYLSILDYGPEKGLNSDVRPYGCNMSFRKSIFQEVGGFDEHLSRISSSLISGEEDDMFLRIKQKGYMVMYNPKALVYHQIPESRLKKEFFEERAYMGGISSAMIQKKHEKTSTIIKDLAYHILHIPINLISFSYSRIKGDSKNSFYYKLHVLNNIGYLTYLFKIKTN